MNRGIALQFRNKFNNNDNLILQNKRVTEIAVIKTEKQWLLNLITKNYYYEKSTYVNIFATLQNLRTFCLEQQIKKLALPKICAGTDGNDWPIISNMLRFIFRNTCIQISIYDINKPILNNNDFTNNMKNNENEFFFADNINHALRENILLNALYIKKIEEVPDDSNCGAHALRVR
ncbi:O-acetyl-ADP-ribose deacetylase 1-like [Aphis craccivora]|uniref:O-acetyl-ADP-ribose deacetylase 1-like n=1 Tax=Aphis craccivora TaxID=307492 RepID=A0A6G0WG62_APHCR|nr:O-acetyl-ADP-ribose deacetylase 1-like [Aphis craccivora]